MPITTLCWADSPVGGRAPLGSRLGLRSRRKIYSGKSRANWPARRRGRPFSGSRLPSPPSSRSAAFPHPPPPASRSRSSGGLAQAALAGAGCGASETSTASKSRTAASAKTARDPEKHDRGPARAYVSGSQTPALELPVPVAADRQKLPICNQNRRSYWACPVPLLRLAGAPVSRFQLSSSYRQQ